MAFISRLYVGRMSVAVDAHGLTRRYGSLLAVDDVTLRVAAGEVLGVLGPNGAGKTTVMRMLTTVLAPTRGGFAVAGIPHTRPLEIRRRIGVLPENAGYPERSTGEEYLTYHARLHGRTRPAARAGARRMLEEVGLLARSRAPIAAYSRGMRQRLGVARALLNDPLVVFLDEPTLGLDPAGQRQVLDHVRTIAAERGAAVLLSTHLLAEVEDNCSRVAILNRGRLVGEGTVAEVVRRAAAPRTGSLRVGRQHVERAADVLRRARPVADVRTAEGRPDVLRFVLAEPDAGADGDSLTGVVRALVEADVGLVSFELERARLSDAFLAVTGER